MVGIAIDKDASAGVHTICVDTQVELDDILNGLGRDRLICGNHLDGRTPTASAYLLIMYLLPAVYGDLGRKRRWF